MKGEETVECPGSRSSVHRFFGFSPGDLGVAEGAVEVEQDPNSSVARCGGRLWCLSLQEEVLDHGYQRRDDKDEPRGRKSEFDCQGKRRKRRREKNTGGTEGVQRVGAGSDNNQGRSEPTRVRAIWSPSPRLAESLLRGCRSTPSCLTRIPCRKARLCSCHERKSRRRPARRTIAQGAACPDVTSR